MLDKSPHPTAVNVPNDLAAHWMPFTANRAFKKNPRLLAGAKDMHYFTVDGRKIIDAAAGMWCCNAGHGRTQISSRRSRKQAADAGLRAAVPVRHSAGLRARQPHRRSGARRPRPRVLLQFRLGSGRHRAQDRAGLSPDQRPGQPHPPDRPRARLSRRRLRRHLGRRHRQQPQDVRLAAGRRRSSARTPTTARSRPSARASRNTARISPTSWSGWSICTAPTPSPP